MIARPLAQNLKGTTSAIVAADGTATVKIRPTGNIHWNITQVSIEMFTAPSGSSCVMRLNDAFVTFLIATGDAAGGDPSILLRVGDELTIEWEDCTAGDQGRVFYLYDEAGYQ